MNLVIPNNTDRIVIEGNKLRIFGVKKSTVTGNHGDNAVYQCRATNEHGLLWANFPLRIYCESFFTANFRMH